AMTLADRLIVMNAGRAEQIGSPMEIYSRPATTFVAGFIGSPAMNMLGGRLDEADPSRFVTGDGIVLPAPPGIASARGKELVYGIRPEGVSLGGTVELKVQVIEPTGSESQIVALLGQTQVTCVFRERVMLQPGEILNVSIDPNAAHLFDAKSGVRLTD
ncbi:MAG: TOBE domain-containing protein, partial [Aliihoeflea sp.]